MNDKPKKTSKTKKSNKPKNGSKRKYSEKTLKILFTMSMNQCAHPDCEHPIVNSKTEASDEAVIGQIAHIYAVSDDGPRGKIGLTLIERNLPDNLILLCPTHHVTVDTQYESYPATELMEWKTRHQRKYQIKVGAAISDLGFAELETTARFLMASAPSKASNCSVIIPPSLKIQKNNLGATSELLLTMGAANSSEVETVVLQATQLDESFADLLRMGFVTQYETFVNGGKSGDELFMAMYDWAGGSSGNKVREAAGLCILTHLFIICDVFEK